MQGAQYPGVTGGHRVAYRRRARAEGGGELLAVALGPGFAFLEQSAAPAAKEADDGGGIERLDVAVRESRQHRLVLVGG